MKWCLEPAEWQSNFLLWVMALYLLMLISELM